MEKLLSKVWDSHIDCLGKYQGYQYFSNPDTKVSGLLKHWFTFFLFNINPENPFLILKGL